ncbi:MAG TPA: DeoR/GlpR family DNA-binding transcription regulator [Chloroflexota bacterium]
MLAVERRELLLRTVGASHAVTVSSLAERLHVSPMTIRRDLDVLASEGRLRRVHGGALGAPDPRGGGHPGGLQGSFADHADDRCLEKDRIGAVAADFVQDGETILLDIGTTTLHLARHLHGRAITVITTNLAACDELLPDPKIELILLGGLVDRRSRSMVGFLAEEALRQVRADRAFLGASAIRADLSVLDDTAVDLRLKRGMIDAAAQVILLVDAQKFGQTRPARVCGPDELDVLITDAAAPAETLAGFAAAGVRVVRV